MRKLWITLALGAALIAIGLLALPFVIDVDRFRGLIEERAELALGREVTLGELDLSFWPFGVRVDSLVVGGLPEEGAGELLSAEAVTVGARLLPLLSKRLEVTSITLEAPRLTIARESGGSWNLARLAREPEGSAGGSADGGGELLVRNLRVSDGIVVIRDAGAGRGEPLEVTLEQVEIDVAELALDRPIAFELSARFSGHEMRLELSGHAGPLAAPAGEVPVDLTLDIEKLPLATLGKLLGSGGGARLAAGQGELHATLTGRAPAELELRGRAEFEDTQIAVSQPDGTTREVPVELAATFDVGLQNAGSSIRLNDVVAELGGTRLAVRGTIDSADGQRVVDLTFPPASLPAAELAKLLSLIGRPAPFAFDSAEPIRFEATLRGPLGPGHRPELEAQARLAGFTLEHPALAQPIEQVGAQVTLTGERIELNELTAVVGSSDLAGRVTLEGFTAPRVGFDLRSRQADFDELFSFLAEEPPARSTETPGGAADPLGALVLRGQLSIASGRFATLDFNGLDAGVEYASGTLALDPVTARLYAGAFAGRITSRPLADPPAFTIDGRVDDLDVGLFLTDNLQMPAVLVGSLDGTIATRGTGTELEQIVPVLEGSGAIDVTDGRVGELNLLATLSRVSGLLGESTLASLSDRLAAEGTPFESLQSKLRLDHGRLHLDDLSFAAAEFKLSGGAAIDLASHEIDGAFELAFSPEVSAALRAEDSLAAKLFFSPPTSRVVLPFTLSGPFSSPRPGVDLEGVARTRIEEELRERLLGGRDRGPTQQVETATDRTPQAAPPARTHEDLAVEFSGTRWRGPILARDLEISGTVSGSNLAQASLVVTDAEGRTVESVEQIADVRGWVASATDRRVRATVAWKMKIDGARLVLGRSPFTVTVTATNDAGESAAASLPVER